jgi:glucosamine-6-phosphate deaminase
LRTRVLPDYEAMSATAADAVATKLRGEAGHRLHDPDGDDAARDVPQARGEAQGRRASRSPGLRSSTWTSTWGLPPDHPASYHVYMQKNFYGLVDVDPERVHVPDGFAPDPEAECERYER